MESMAIVDTGARRSSAAPTLEAPRPRLVCFPPNSARSRSAARLARRVHRHRVPGALRRAPACAGCAAEAGSAVAFWAAALRVHVYQLCEDSAGEEADDGGGDGDGAGVSYRDWQLPSRAFAGLWDALVYETDVKSKLLRYAATALLFADKQARASA